MLANKFDHTVHARECWANMTIHRDVLQCGQATDGAGDRAAQLVVIQVQIPAHPPRSTLTGNYANFKLDDSPSYARWMW